MSRIPSIFLSHGAPTFAVEPGRLGPLLTALGARLPRPKAVVVTPPPVTPLPYPENTAPLDPFQLFARKTIRGWEVGSGPGTFRHLGQDEHGAQDIVRTLRELRPTEWVTIGKERTVVEYGLVRDAAGNATANGCSCACAGCSSWSSPTGCCVTCCAGSSGTTTCVPSTSWPGSCG